MRRLSRSADRPLPGGQLIFAAAAALAPKVRVMAKLYLDRVPWSAILSERALEECRRRLLPYLLLLFVAVAPGYAHGAQPDNGKPKFGPYATTIQQSHEYLRTHRAPDYWALSPYYVPQISRSSCSLATVTMLLNALRPLPARADQTLVSQSALLETLKTKAQKAGEDWASKTADDGSGVTFPEFHDYVLRSLNAYDLDAEVETFKPSERSQATLRRLRSLLSRNERSADDVALVYYNQGVVTGDWDGPHISPIGAYDPRRRRALIMDVDRQWYVPYWTSDERLLEAMLRPAPAEQKALAGQTGGVIWVKLRRSGPANVHAGSH
jgi:hypothetical protein